MFLFSKISYAKYTIFSASAQGFPQDPASLEAAIKQTEYLFDILLTWFYHNSKISSFILYEEDRHAPEKTIVKEHGHDHRLHLEAAALLCRSASHRQPVPAALQYGGQPGGRKFCGHRSPGGRGLHHQHHQHHGHVLQWNVHRRQRHHQPPLRGPRRQKAPSGRGDHHHGHLSGQHPVYGPGYFPGPPHAPVHVHARRRPGVSLGVSPDLFFRYRRPAGL